MNTANLRAWQSEHADDFRRMAGLVTAIGIAFATAALYAYLKATGNDQPAECIEERDAK